MDIERTAEEVGVALFGQNSFDIRDECLLGSAQSIWEWVSSNFEAQFYFEEDDQTSLSRFLQSELRWLYGKKVYVSITHGVPGEWAYGKITNNSFFWNIVDLAEKNSNAEFIIACDEYQEVVVVDHLEHYSYLCRPYSSFSKLTS